MSKKRTSRSRQKSGQVALIVILLMIVILTIGISLISRSITDVRISEDEKEALRSFSAAEAGIEEVLRQSSLTPGEHTVPIGDLEAEVTVEELQNGVSQTISKDEVMSILVDGSGATQMTIHWLDSTKSEETDIKASLEVGVYEADYDLQRYGVNPVAAGRNNGFEDVSQAGTGSFSYSKQINLTADAKLVRVKALYDETTVMIETNGTLATQQYRITSVVGNLGNQASDKIGKVVVSRTIPVVPPIFDFTLFTNSGNLESL